MNTTKTATALGEQVSLGESAWNFLRRATAPARHRARVEATVAAAMAAADGSEGAALALLCLDLAGVGGRAGVTGARSQRLLSSLGTGRWQATDGGAFEGAAAQAVNQLAHPGTETRRLTPEAVYGWVEKYPEQCRTLACLIVATMGGQPVEDHVRLAVDAGDGWANLCARPARSGDVVASLCPISGEIEDWGSVLQSACGRAERAERREWRRRVADYFRGGARLDRERLLAPVHVRWTWNGPEVSLPLREVLAGKRAPACYGVAS